MSQRLLLGAPDIYPLPAEPLRAVTGVRMDVAAFVGVAPRGPARLPALQAPWAEPPRGLAAPSAALRSVAVRVESWDGYRRLFGGFEGPGLLPYAVAAFFENGGRSAYIVRIVHDYGEGDPANDAGTATGVLAGAKPRGGGDLVLRARNEGSWGNRLRARIGFTARPLAFRAASASELTLESGSPAAPGTLLRLWLPGGEPVLRFVSDLRLEWAPARPVRLRKATLDAPLPDLPGRAEIIEAELTVVDGAGDGLVRDEVHAGLGLSPLHPRWVAAVLHRDSALVRPDPAWIDDELILDDPRLAPAPHAPAAPFTGGLDRYPEIDPEDFFDPRWVPGDEQSRSGVHQLVELEEVATVVVPDLYSPGPIAPAEAPEPVLTLAGERFETCVELPPSPAPDDPGDGSDGELDGLRLDPTVAPDRERIVELQGRLVSLAASSASWIALLDVPPGLNQREILAWRSDFDSMWAASYHPWVSVARADDTRDPLVTVPPSAFAAGIVARREIALGLPHGPANEILLEAVAVLDRVSRERHDALHQASVNVLLPERDGIRLTAARTLSRDPRWRQLSVRRLVTMLRRTLLRQMQWTVFEPNDARLRDELRHLLEVYLRQLYRAGAFSGATPRDSFFVRCDEMLNPPAIVDAGQLVCHVGVAPAEPLEFIVLRLTREGDGSLAVEE